MPIYSSFRLSTSVEVNGRSPLLGLYSYRDAIRYKSLSEAKLN